MVGCGAPWPPDDPGWRADVRADVAALVGPATAFEVEAPLRVGETDGVEHLTVLRHTRDGTRAPAHLLRPTDLPQGELRPGILLLHGHGPGADNWIDAPDAAERALGPILARAGFVVFAPDERSFGGFLPGGLEHQAYHEALVEEGEVYARVAAQDARASLAWLAARPEVDPERLGILGHSLGGFLALLTALSEPEVRATVISGIFLPFDSLFSSDNHACQHLDPLADVGRSAELGAALAPAAVQIHFGAEDDEFARRYGGYDNALELLDRWWADPVGPNPEIVLSEGLGHAVDPEAHLDFFERNLMR